MNADTSFPNTRARSARVVGALAVALAAAWGTGALAAGGESALQAQAGPPRAGADGGGVMEIGLSRRSGVVSAWLGNGVRVHHRRMGDAGKWGAWEDRGAQGGDEAEPRVQITVMVAGGEALESDATRGLSAAAGAAWSVPSTRSIPPEPMRRQLDARRIRVYGRGAPDSLMLRIDAPASEVEEAMRIAALLLTEPVVEDAAVERWARSAAGSRPGRHPRWAASDAIRQGALPGDERRFRPLPPEVVRGVTAQSAQSWLDRSLRGGMVGEAARPAPIEASIVGDVGVEEAMAAAAKHMGSLPARERVGPETFRGPRALPPASRAGPARVVLTEASSCGRSLAGAGFFGTDTLNFGDHRLLWLGLMVLDERVTLRLRERGWAGMEDVQPVAIPGGLSPGDCGLILMTALVPAERVDEAAEVMEREIAGLAANPPTADELARARADATAEVEGMLGSPVYWSIALAYSTYRGYGPETIAEVADVLRRAESASVAEAWGRYARPERGVRVTTRVEGGVGEPSAAR